MAQIRRVCVFCGSSQKVPQVYLDAAAALGRFLARQGCEVVYGGGSTGLMGALADAALAAGGRVIGVIPEHFYTPNLAHTGLTRLEVVPDMHTRKARMAQLADAFIALPGGFGTWEELFEALTWAQIGLHEKPVGLLNVQGFYTPLLDFIAQARSQGFLFKDHEEMLVVAEDPAGLWAKLLAYQPRPHAVQAWLAQQRRGQDRLNSPG